MSRSILDRYLKKTRPIQAKSYLWKNDDDYVPLQKYDDNYNNVSNYFISKSLPNNQKYEGLIVGLYLPQTAVTLHKM